MTTETTNRRSFLKNMALTAIGCFALSKSGMSSTNAIQLFLNEEESIKKQDVGIQLYTLRNAMQVNPLKVLERLSAIGYKHLELANYAEGKFYGYQAKEFKKICSDLGLTVISSHFNFDENGFNQNQAERVAHDHAELGAAYCIHPWVSEERRKTIDSYKRLVEIWNKIGEVFKNTGIQFGYHNHNFEFDIVEGQIPYFDVYMKNMDKNLIVMELDLYWLSYSNQDIIKLFNDYPGRFPLFHMKDMDVNKAFAPVGEGTINFKHILEHKETAGMKYLFVEQDHTGGRDPLECVATSFTNLTQKIL